ncbi:MAG TPA: methyltransferase domain-containing protein [Candidatus Binataceae bacterium]|nr:methyltransferase domain-containing protein [Candidatus Binataceae bacterium]
MEPEILRLQKTLYNSKNPTRRWLHCTRRDWIIGELRRNSHEKRGKALEVGFGSGVYLPFLAELYAEVVAVDLQPAFLDHGRSLSETLPNLRVLPDDITGSTLHDDQFDLILCSEVIEHITGWQKALAEMYRLLRPGGTLLLSTPQPWSPLELAGKIAFKPGIVSVLRWLYGEEVLETGHCSLLSQKRITAELEAVGFRITKHFKSGVYLPVAAEFLGSAALRFEQWLESRLRNSPLDQLLWVQFYLAEK